MMSAIEDAMRYLKRDGEIAIIDGANTSMYRRDLIRDRVAKEVFNFFFFFLYLKFSSFF